jgi:hypothetical protein
MNQTPLPYVPYGVPAPGGAPTAAPLPDAPLVLPPQRGLGLKWAFAILSFVGVASTTLWRLAGSFALPAVTSHVVGALGGLAHVASVLVAIVWVSKAWASVPVEPVKSMHRQEAVLRLFIPIYNLYWMFVVNLRLCAAIDAVLARRGTQRTPRNAAIAAGVLTILSWTSSSSGEPWTTLAAGAGAAVFWFVYMNGVDSLRRSASSAQGSSDR